MIHVEDHVAHCRMAREIIIECRVHANFYSLIIYAYIFVTVFNCFVRESSYDALVVQKITYIVFVDNH